MKIIEHFKRDEKETETVYIGVDEEKFNPDNYNKEELTKKYIGENINKKIITYICRISEQKRPLLLLEIIAKLKKERQDFKVLVVGDGNLLPKMKARAQELGLGEEVMFLGNIVNTAEIYRISDVTVNCSLKEGLALTAYESLSMGVPVISSDVGGQKELVNNDVGKIVKVVQNEEDIYLEKYSEKEIQSYVDSINEILNNLEFYKSNCRKRILNNFTIKNMIQKMSIILEETAKKPNINKIENGKGLLNNINIGKELITTNLKNDEIEYKWECTEYEKATYGQAYSMKKMNYKKEIIKEKLWKIPMWRGFIKAVHKIRH